MYGRLRPDKTFGVSKVNRTAGPRTARHRHRSFSLILPLLRGERLSTACRPDLSDLFALIALEHVSHPEHSAVDDCATVGSQINDACLDNEAAEFDQVSGALAALNLPSAHVIAGQRRFPAIVG